MNIWVIVVIIAVVAMILGPVMMLQPNSAQRGQEQLRRKARELGMRVRIMSLPKRNTDIETPEAMPVYYLVDESASDEQKARDVRTHTEWLLMRASYAHAAHFLDNWQWHGVGRASMDEAKILEEVLVHLPNSVHAVEATPQGYGFYWSEAGGEARLTALLPLLQKLRSVRC